MRSIGEAELLRALVRLPIDRFQREEPACVDPPGSLLRVPVLPQALGIRGEHPAHEPDHRAGAHRPGGEGEDAEKHRDHPVVPGEHRAAAGGGEAGEAHEHRLPAAGVGLQQAAQIAAH